MVVPSGTAQAVLAAVSLALPGQTAPHHCPAHWAAEPPRDITPPGPFEKGSAPAMPRSGGIFASARCRAGLPRTVFGQGRPNPSLHGCTRGVSWAALPGTSPLLESPNFQKAPPLHRVSDTEHRTPEESASLASCRELRSLSRAGPAPTRRAPAWFGSTSRRHPAGRKGHCATGSPDLR